MPGDENTNLFRLLIKGASGSFLLKVIFTASGLLTSLILARVLGVNDYGAYAYVMSWIMLLGIPSGLGLEKVMVRYVATYNREEEWGKIKGLVNYSVYAVLIVSFFLALSVFVFMQFVIADKAESRIYIPLLVALALLPLNSILSRQDAALRGFQWIISGQLAPMLVKPLLFVAFVGSVWHFFRSFLNVSVVISLNILATVTAILFASYLLHRASPKQVIQSKPVYETRDWIKSAFPLMLMGGLYMINGQADIIMLGFLKGPEFSGVYQIANRGAGLILLVLSAVIASLAPLIAHLYAGRELNRLQHLITRACRLTLLLSLPFALTLVLFGKQILGLFGEEFVTGYTALVILGFSQLVNVASGPVANILMMTGHERDAARGVGISTVINVALNALLIPFFGLEGAAIATGSSTIVWNLIFIWYVKERINIHPTVFGIIRF